MPFSSDLDAPAPPAPPTPSVLSAQALFECLSTGRARRVAAEWESNDELDLRVPALGDTAVLASKCRAIWLAALEQWHFEQGALSPALLFASRVWGLLGTNAGRLLMQGGPGVPGPEALARLAMAAFPVLAAPQAPVRFIAAVVASQAMLEAGEGKAWATWPLALRLEAVRLLKWREVMGERPDGSAARCLARLRGAVAWEWPGVRGEGVRADAAAALGDWPFGRAVLAGSLADTLAPELVLLSWAVRRVVEPPDTTVACVTARLRWAGLAVDAFDQQAELPTPLSGISAQDALRLCRRVGLQARIVPWETLTPSDLPALCRLHDGSCLMLLDLAVEGFRVYAPGVPFPFRLVERARLSAAQVAFVCVMPGAVGVGPRRPRAMRRLRFDVLQGPHYRGAIADAQVKRALHPQALAWPDVHPGPPALVALNLPALLSAHQRLSAPGSPLHGVFRQMQLHASTPLLCWEQIPSAMKALFKSAVGLASTQDQGVAAHHVARHFMDFLRIHPFLNGNRRMAMAFAVALARHLGWVLDWAGTSRAQLYFAVRCGAAGHPRALVGTLAQCMRAAADTGFERP